MHAILRQLVSTLALSVVCGAVGGCSPSSALEGGGIGAVCSADAECHAGSCDASGLCTAPCGSDGDCPAPAACFTGSCAVPLQVTGLWDGVVSGKEGWAYAFHKGLKNTAAKLPYVRWNYEENVNNSTPGVVESAIDRHVKEGSTVIIGNSYDQQAIMLDKADTYPDVKFLLGGAGSAVNGKNFVSFSGEAPQAMYTAGKLAATKAKKRIAFIIDLVTPGEVRLMNAFTLGALSVNPKIIVEVAWIGFWLDFNSTPTYEYKGEKLFREELLAARLIDSGCEIVGHNSDSQRAVRYIEAKVNSGAVSNVWSIANNDSDGCRTFTSDGPTGALMGSCFGAVYENFGMQISLLVDAAHRHTLDASKELLSPMTNDPDTTGVGFLINPAAGLDNDAAQAIIASVASKDPALVFAGPYGVTGQRDKDNDGKPDAVQAVEAGELVSDEESNRMCWFVKGVVQKADPLDPHSADVDALVPDGDAAPPPDLLGPPGAPPGTRLRCHENL